MIGALRIGLMLPAIVLATALVAIVQPPVLALGLNPYLIPRLWHRAAARMFGMRIRRRGDMAAGRPLLLVSNHVSWTDIIVIGAQGDLSFVAKADMVGWPVFGWLSTLQRTIFVERDKTRKSGEQANDIGSRLTAGEALVLFAEGTTGDGNFLLPFKSSLFGAADVALAAGAEAIHIQPVAIAYTRLQGMAMTRRERALAAWIGDATLVPHMLRLLREGALDVTVAFGEPIMFKPGDRRKRIAGMVEAEVRAMMARALREP